MKIDQEVVKYPMGWVLVILLVTIAAYLWIVDMFAMQRVFGVLLASELLVFAMLAYLYSRSSFSKVSKPWLLIGSIGVAAFLFLALTIAT